MKSWTAGRLRSNACGLSLTAVFFFWYLSTASIRIVRFEDLIFHPKELIATICLCAGAVPKQDTFTYVVDAGKWGSAHSGRYVGYYGEHCYLLGWTYMSMNLYVMYA
jgi:hypothetical protein